MKAFVILGLATLSPAAFAMNGAAEQVTSMLSESKCFAAASELMHNWHAKRDWHAMSPDFDGGQPFATPTDHTGVWVEATFYPNKTVELMRMAPDSRTILSWKGDKCEPKARVSTRSPASIIEGEKPAFTDHDLEQLNGGALIYVWSPQMPISLRGFGMAEKVAKQHHLSFVPLLDPGADTKSAIDAVNKNSLPSDSLRRVRSVELSYRGALMHFPTIIVTKGGRFSGVDPGLPVSDAELERFVTSSGVVGGGGQ